VAIHEALDSLDVQLPGISVSMKTLGNKEILFLYCRMVEYSAEEDDIIQVADYLFVPGWQD
jgi:hypothetical protein